MTLHFSDTEFARRREAVQQSMADSGIDVLLLFNPSSHFWLTGYDTFGYCFFQCLVFTQNGDATLLTRTPDLRQAQLTSNIADIRIWTDKQTANPTEQLRDMLISLGLSGKRLGVEYDTHGLTAHYGKQLDAALSEWPLGDASLLITKLRLIKSAEELVYVRRAGKLADMALDAAIATTKAGVSEGEVLAAMHNAIFREGGDYPGNPFIIGSGPTALLCRYKSGRRRLSASDQLTLEWAGTERQYHSAAMRTLVIGEPSRRQEHMLTAAKAALLACEAEFRPGRTFDDVFQAHAKTLDAHGLAKHRLNACGYSLGTVYAPCWMDWPMFYEGNPVVIEPGMVLFLHMIIMDSDSGLAMCLGRTSITQDGAPECLSNDHLEMIAL